MRGGGGGGGGGSGGAMVLCRSFLIWIIVGQGPTALAGGHFLLSFLFYLFFLFLFSFSLFWRRPDID